MKASSFSRDIRQSEVRPRRDGAIITMVLSMLTCLLFVTAMRVQGEDLPESVAERLKFPVDANYRRVPLQDVLQSLCNQVKVGLELDGNALKDAGYTKNMPQTLMLGKVPMNQVLATIASAYPDPGNGRGLVVSIDQANNSITVTTRKFAETRGLKIHPLPAAPPKP